MEIKNVYVSSHGLRIKNSYFQLEPNVRVYMNCSDSVTDSSIIGNLLSMKYVIGKKNNILDYIELSKIYHKLSNEVMNVEKLLEIIKTELNYHKSIVKEKLIKYSKKIGIKLTKIENILKKMELKYDKNDKKIKKIIKIRNKELYILNLIKKYLNKYDIEKLKILDKKSYEKIVKYEKKYIKYEKKSKYIDYLFSHQYGLKKPSNKIYNNIFNICVFSGNLNNRIRKYIKNISSPNFYNLNICPNIVIFPDYYNYFRDFVGELPLKIEIKKNDKVIVNSDEIEESINKYIQRNLAHKEMINIYSTIENVYKNKELVMMSSTIKSCKNIYENQISKFNSMIEEFEREISIIIGGYMGNFNYDSIMDNESNYYNYEKMRIEEIAKVKKKIANLKKGKRKLMEKYEELLKDKYTIDINKSKDHLFYPLHIWDDCEIDTTFSDVLYEYIRDYMEQKGENKGILFNYYDVQKDRYLRNNECYKKQMLEYKKYSKKKNFMLRDMLIYLYYYYGLNENKDLKLDVNLALCLSEFEEQKRIYKMSRLSVYNYYKKMYKIDGKYMSLRTYDNNVAQNEKVIEEKEKGKRYKKSCSLYRVSNGCPSHCDLPHDIKRRMCVVKGRKKEFIRKKEIKE